MDSKKNYTLIAISSTCNKEEPRILCVTKSLKKFKKFMSSYDLTDKKDYKLCCKHSDHEEFGNLSCYNPNIDRKHENMVESFHYISVSNKMYESKKFSFLNCCNRFDIIVYKFDSDIIDVFSILKKFEVY